MTVEVSVIMPMRNAELYVRAALASVLEERFVPLEVIVVNDGSTDRSGAFVAAIGDMRVRLVDGPQRGISACLNLGLKCARGSIIMRCDADDLYPPGRIQAQMSWLTSHPDHDAVCGAFSTVDSRGRLVANLVAAGKPHAEDIDAELREGVVRTHLCTFAIRAHTLRRIGAFREYFETGEDIDLQLRLGEGHRVAYVPMNTYAYRLHEASVTHIVRRDRRRFFDDVAREFQRQRLADGADALAQGKAPSPPSGDSSGPTRAADQICGMLSSRSWEALNRGARSSAIALACRAVAVAPDTIDAWKNLWKILIRTVLPHRIS